MDRAQELYDSMRLRGFRGEFHYAQVPQCRFSGVVYTIACVGLFLFARMVNVPNLLGSLFVR